MLSREQFEQARQRAARMLDEAGITLTDEECEKLEIADFGLGDLEQTGLELITYVNNDRYCAKELVLFPRQTCPEHLHPMVDGKPGKLETFRCRKGTVWLYVEGEPTHPIKATPPPGREDSYTVFN